MELLRRAFPGKLIYLSLVTFHGVYALPVSLHMICIYGVTSREKFIWVNLEVWSNCERTSWEKLRRSLNIFLESAMASFTNRLGQYMENAGRYLSDPTCLCAFIFSTPTLLNKNIYLKISWTFFALSHFKIRRVSLPDPVYFSVTAIFINEFSDLTS